jgi:hypothetical protein
MDDAPRARGLAEATLQRVRDPDVRFAMKVTLWKVAHDLGEPISLAGVARELEGHREPKYTELSELMDMAVEAGEWQLAEDWANAGLALATPEAFRADYPKSEFSDELAARKAANRRTTCLAYKGWALHEQGRTDEALEAFAEGGDEMNFSYVGAPETPLYSYWGRVLFETGDLDRAAELVESAAVFGGSELAMDTLREIHVRRTGSEEGFDQAVLDTRRRLARTVDDFTLPTYGGEDFQLASTRGKTLLLNFWFPT